MNIKPLFASTSHTIQNNYSLKQSVRFSGEMQDKFENMKQNTIRGYLNSNLLDLSKDSGEFTSIKRMDVLKLIQELLEDAKTRSTDKDDDNNKTLISEKDILDYFGTSQKKKNIQNVLNEFVEMGLLKKINTVDATDVVLSASAFHLTPLAEKFLNVTQ